MWSKRRKRRGGGERSNSNSNKKQIRMQLPASSSLSLARWGIHCSSFILRPDTWSGNGTDGGLGLGLMVAWEWD